MNAAYIVTVVVVTCILCELPTSNAGCPSSLGGGKRNRTRCTNHSECADDRACLGHKCQPCKCRLKEQCFLTEANRVDCDCSNDTLHIGDFCECPIPKPITCSQPQHGNIVPHDNSTSFPVGFLLPYHCIPCTYVLTGNGTLECQPDGTWTAPNCAHIPDVGVLTNGQTIPSGSVGCVSANVPICDVNLIGVTNGLRFDGGFNEGFCHCDALCCQYNDCCFDADC